MVQELTTPSAKAVGHTALPINDTLIYAQEVLGRIREEAYPTATEPDVTLRARLRNVRAEVQHLAGGLETARVRACNSHYQLLSALKAISSRLDRWMNAGIEAGKAGRDRDFYELKARAEQAISQAEEGL